MSWLNPSPGNSLSCSPQSEQCSDWLTPVPGRPSASSASDQQSDWLKPSPGQQSLQEPSAKHRRLAEKQPDWLCPAVGLDASSSAPEVSAQCSASASKPVIRSMGQTRSEFASDYLKGANVAVCVNWCQQMSSLSALICTASLLSLSPTTSTQPTTLAVKIAPSLQASVCELSGTSWGTIPQWSVYRLC